MCVRSCIIGPPGQMLAERVFDQDAILTAEIDPSDIARGKYVSTCGHSARPDVFRLMFNETPQSAVQTNAPTVFGVRSDFRAARARSMRALDTGPHL